MGDKITHLAVERTNQNWYFVFSKWKSGKITRQYYYKLGEMFVGDIPEVIDCIPLIDWKDVRKENKDNG